MTAKDSLQNEIRQILILTDLFYVHSGTATNTGIIEAIHGIIDRVKIKIPVNGKPI
jgi:hypothetical protein